MTEDNKGMPLIGGAVADETMKMLRSSGALDMIYQKSKRIMWSMVQYKEMQMMYSCAIKEIQTKFDVLNTEFKFKNKRNPISSVTTRLKSLESIVGKLVRNGLPLTLKSVEDNIYDVAGVRVICPFIDDIYKVAEAILKQDDITLIKIKDYIKEPKSNGYRSLHIIVSIPVFFEEKKKDIKVEIQIRTIAMDFWASLDHQLKYKKNIADEERVIAELKACADVINDTDEKMQRIRRELEAAEDIPTEEELLLQRLSKMDMPID